MGNPEMAGLVLAILASISLVQGNVFTVDLAVLTTQRLDPIVFNGESPSGHVHTIAGASGFSQTGTYDELINSKCTTGNLKKDLSNYWVPSLYIKKPSGEVHYVEMYMAVYYKLINDCCQPTPLCPGPSMLSPQDSRCWLGVLLHQGLGREELMSTINVWELGLTPQTSLQTQNCVLEESELRSLFLPVGMELTSTHPFMMPTVFFEAIYQTQDIYQPGDQLVYSMRDYTGYGFHGDFLMGWEDGVIDKMIDYCTYTANQEVFCNAEEFAGRWGGPDGSCHWEGQGNGQYTGVLSELPPCGQGCRPEMNNANRTMGGEN